MSTFVLVPGMWLGGWAWDEVADRLRADGHVVRPVTLTGVGDRVDEDGPGVDLDRHTRDVIEAVGDDRDVILVGHSYGGMPVTMAADRIPEQVARVVYVDSGPLADGARQIDMSDPEETSAMETGAPVPSRPWEPADDPVLLAGLDDDAIALLKSRGHHRTRTPRSSQPLTPGRRQAGAGVDGRVLDAARPGARRWWRSSTRCSRCSRAPTCTGCRPATGRC